MAHSNTDFVTIAEAFVSPPLLRDEIITSTSEAQDETLHSCLPFLKAAFDPTRSPLDFNQHGVPRLNRNEHVRYLERALEKFPASYVGLDSSRPWMVYWGLMGLVFLGEEVESFRERVIKTFRPMQNVSGGLGGGQGQRSHLASTYAAVLSLALVGERGAYELIDRRTMWHWLGRLKQANGGFLICEDGEQDVRGAYVAFVLISLFNLSLELPADAPARAYGMKTFTDGLGEHLSRCQTYEGGIGSAPGNESHGAYTFCALACLSLIDQPHVSIPRYLEVDRLLSWLSSRQYAPEGGFAGRTNKLVDTCYSHWIGGCWPLLQAALNGPRRTADFVASASVGNLFSREGLGRYILLCCQAEGGGLRDKPTKSPDSYHTCYALAGLSLTQHYHYYEPPPSQGPFASAVTWRVVTSSQIELDSSDLNVSDDIDGVAAVNPVYVIPHTAVEAMRGWAIQQADVFG